MVMPTTAQPMTLAELELRQSLSNLGAYLRFTHPSLINFVELREQLARLEQRRDDLVFGQGAH